MVRWEGEHCTRGWVPRSWVGEEGGLPLQKFRAETRSKGKKRTNAENKEPPSRGLRLTRNKEQGARNKSTCTQGSSRPVTQCLSSMSHAAYIHSSFLREGKTDGVVLVLGFFDYIGTITWEGSVKGDLPGLGGVILLGTKDTVKKGIRLLLGRVFERVVRAVTAASVYHSKP